MAVAVQKLHFTGNDEADALLASEPFALLVGFALDQQVPVQTAFSGPLKLKQRLGTLDPGKIAATDPATLLEAFREKPAIRPAIYYRPVLSPDEKSVAICREETATNADIRTTSKGTAGEPPRPFAVGDGHQLAGRGMGGHAGDDVVRDVPLTAQALRRGPAFVLDATAEDEHFSVRFDGLMRVDGPSELGAFHYVPVLFHGGPVRKDRTFFFFSYEGFRNRAGATAFTSTVPTTEMYNGDFSKWVDSAGRQIPVYDPISQVANAGGGVTRTQFPNNQIPKSLFDPFAVKAISVFQTSGTLTPNTGAAPGTVGYVNNNYSVANGSQVSPITKISIKGDHNFSSRDRISGYYGYDREYLKPGADGRILIPAPSCRKNGWSLRPGASAGP
jgi:hypothetical protein